MIFAPFLFVFIILLFNPSNYSVKCDDSYEEGSKDYNYIPRCPESFDKLNPKDPTREKEIYQSMIDHASFDNYIRESMIQSGRLQESDNNNEIRRVLSDKIITIPIIFHLFTGKRRKAIVGKVPLAAFQAQINVMNAAYNSVGIQFTLRRVKWYKNSVFFNSCDQKTTQMKSRTGISNDKYLNVWVCDSEYLGFSTFPWFYPESSKLHGVVLDYLSLPTAKGYKPYAAYDEGDTLVHEVGHFFGLYHTFQDGCYGSGDDVSDTPAEADPAFGKACFRSPPRDTCSSPGVDPVTNYMDYTNDICLTQFSPLQRARMRTILLQYKPTMTKNWA